MTSTNKDITSGDEETFMYPIPDPAVTAMTIRLKKVIDFTNVSQNVIEEEKHGGPVVDLEFNTVERKKNPPPAPDLPPLPSGIYLTKSNTFQVRWRNKVKGEKVAQLGTYKTVEDAVTALEAYKLSVSRNAYE